MSKLTRTLALLASIAVVSTAFVACGGNTESTSSAGGNTSSAAPAENNSSEAGGESSAEAGGESSTEAGGESSAEGGEAGGELEAGAVNLPDTDDTLTIVCWTDADLQNMFDVYANHSDANVVYQNCGDNGGDASTKYASYLNSGDDVDLFVAEAGWILNYINDDSMSAPLSDLGITADDYKDAYQYTVEIGTDNNGVLKAASWQAAAGGYAYNTTLAEQYLGVTDADAMQAKISDWDKFAATAEELKTASEGKVTIAATIGGLWQAFSTAKNAAWVKDGVIQTDVAKEFTDMMKGYVDNGYINPKVKQWTPDWTNAGLQGETLGYFYSTWCLGEGAQLEQNGGTDGNWNIVVGPQTYFWGGSWLCVSPNCNTASEASKFVKAFTTDASIMEEYALYSGDFANNKVAMNKIIADGTNENPLLGGQDQFAVLADVAEGIKMSDSITKYDQSLKDTFIDALTGIEEGAEEPAIVLYDADTIIGNFTKQALANNPDLTVE